MATPTGTVFTVTDLSGATYNLHGVLYGECATAAATQAKVVSIQGVTSLTKGLSIRVRFQYAQTYNGAPTLNVNSLGAKTIKLTDNKSAEINEWEAGEILDFVYDGTTWVIVKKGKIRAEDISSKLDINTSGGIKTISGGGQTRYVKIAQLHITRTYVNYPIVFEISMRGYGFCHLEVLFKNANSVDPDLDSFETDCSTLGFWIKKTDTSTWEIYGYLNESYGLCTVHRITGSGVAYVDITVLCERAENQEPTDAVYVTRGWGAKYANVAESANTAVKLSHTELDSTTIDNTAGSFAFSGSGEPWASTDWVGLQIGDNRDKFQLSAKGNTLVFRQNDSGGTNDIAWLPWVELLTSGNYGSYAADKTAITNITRSGTTFTATRANGETFTFTQQDTNTTYSAGTGLSQSGTTFSVSKDNASDIINLLDTGTADTTANDYIITQYASGGTAHKEFIRRPAAHVVNGTLVKAALGTNATHGDAYLRKDGTWVVPSNTKNTAGSTDTSSKIFLIGATSQAANPQTYSHDTAYVGTDGCLYSGGSKVLTSHQDISGKANLSGATFTGAITLPSSKYYAAGGGLNAKNSDLINLNGMFWADDSSTFGEGINFFRSDTPTWDSFAAKDGVFYFGSNKETGAALDGNADINCGRVLLSNSTRDLTQENNGSDSTLTNAVGMVDKNNKEFIRLYGQSKANGDVSGWFQIRTYNGTTANSYRGIGLTMTKDGTLSYSVYNASAFRSAIGAGTSSLAIGTTSTTAMAGDTNVTQVHQTASVSGKWRKITLGSTEYDAYDTAISATDGHLFMSKSVAVQASTGTIKAAAFNGAGATFTGQVHINFSEDVGSTNGNGSLVIGSKTAANIGIDNNEILARNNNKTASLSFNIDNSTDTSNLATVIFGSASDTNAYMNVRYKTAATSTTTGALRVGGGVGVAGNVYANTFFGRINNNTTVLLGSFTYSGQSVTISNVSDYLFLTVVSYSHGSVIDSKTILQGAWEPPGRIRIGEDETGNPVNFFCRMVRTSATAFKLEYLSADTTKVSLYGSIKIT